MYGNPTLTRLEWYPEYQVNLGAPQDPGGMPTSVDGYFDPGSGLYVRHFQNGIVLVNNSPSGLVYNPAQTMQQVIVNGWGGGVRPGDIDPATNSYVAGSLTASLVSSVTVGPYSSVILINQGVPIQTPPGGGGGNARSLPPFTVLAPSEANLSAIPSQQFLESNTLSGSIMLPENGPAARDAALTDSAGSFLQDASHLAQRVPAGSFIGGADLPPTPLDVSEVISESLSASRTP
jgi:hypothetical protein